MLSSIAALPFFLALPFGMWDVGNTFSAVLCNANFDIIYFGFGLWKNARSFLTLRIFGDRLLGIGPDHILFLFLLFLAAVP